MDKVNIAQKLGLINEYWSPKVVAELNESYIKLAKLKGEFTWHHHANEDELFLVIKGNLTIRLRDKDIQLGAGEFFMIPKNVEHLPIAMEEVQVMLIEPKSTLNTGNVVNEKTVEKLDWI